MTFMADCVYRVDRLPPVGSGKNIQLTHADLNKMGDIPSTHRFSDVKDREIHLH